MVSLRMLEFHRVLSQDDPDLEPFLAIYEKSYPIDGERLPLDDILRRTSGTTEHLAYGFNSVDVNKYIVVAKNEGLVVGGRIFNFISGQTMNSQRRNFGVGLYHFVDSGQRRKGYGTQIDEHSTQILKGLGIEFILNEVNDPKVMAREDIELDSVAMDVNERLMFWDRLGYRAIEPQAFNYHLPGMTSPDDRYDGTMLCIKTMRAQSEIAIPVLRQSLWLYTWAEFSGGHSGHRLPMEDEAYRMNARQLNELQSRRSLSLVPLTSRLTLFSG